MNKKAFLITLPSAALLLASCGFLSPRKSSSNSDVSSQSQIESSASDAMTSSSQTGDKTSDSQENSSKSSASNPTSDVKVESTLNSKIYYLNQNGSYSSETLLTTYFVGYDQIPYLSAYQTLNFFHEFNGKTSFSVADGRLVVENPSYLPDNLIVDPANDTIYFSDYEHFAANEGSGTDMATCSVGDVSWYPYLKLLSAELLDDDRSLTFNLGDYGADILYYNEDVYVPAGHLLSAINGAEAPIAFNGTNYYLAYEDYLTSSSSSYAKVAYGGSYVKKTTRDSSFAKYNYDYLCFFFDHFYGLIHDSDLYPISSTFEKTGYKSKLLSTNVSTYNQALFDFVETVLDEGHSHTDYNSYYGESYAKEGKASTYGSRNSEISDAANSVYSERYYADADAGYFTSGDVAILRFDEFVDSYEGKNYTSQHSTPGYDGFDVVSFFYQSFNKISSNSNIKNVVIDLSMNGGGEVGSLFGAIGFLGREFTTTITNPLTGSVLHETYQVDTNLDGKFNSSDGYKGKYNFYILTSGYSYSCASFMSELSHENGLATPIGHKSGGGACSVGYFATLDGAMGWLSSNNLAAYEREDGSFVNYEHGYPVESKYQFGYSTYFNMSKLVAKIDSF